MTGEKSTILQVKFWALVGPFISLLTLCVIYMKALTAPSYFPVILLIGVPLAWRWKLWGAAATTLLLAAIFAYTYSDMPLNDRFWNLGMASAIALSHFITALSFEEVESIVDVTLLESRSRLENLWKVDEKQKHTEEELKNKQEQIRELVVKARSYQKLVDLSSNELYEAREENQKIAEELSTTKSDIKQLQVQLQNVSDDPPAMAKYLQLKEQFEEKQRVLTETRRELFLAQEKLLQMKKEHEEERTYNLNEVEELLQAHMLRMDAEQQETEDQHEKELDAVHSLLAELLKKQE